MSQLRDFVKESVEAEVLVRNFAERKRVHLNTPINIGRLYKKLWESGQKLNRAKFEAAFERLSALGYGVVEVRSRGCKEFKPKTSIKAIGLEVFPNADTSPKLDKVLHTGEGTQVFSHDPHSVVVLFRMKGKRCKAEVPEELLEDFERLVNL